MKNGTRVPFGKTMRKEYRMLSVDERAKLVKNYLKKKQIEINNFNFKNLF